MGHFETKILNILYIYINTDVRLKPCILFSFWPTEILNDGLRVAYLKFSFSHDFKHATLRPWFNFNLSNNKNKIREVLLKFEDFMFFQDEFKPKH